MHNSVLKNLKTTCNYVNKTLIACNNLTCQNHLDIVFNTKGNKIINGVLTSEFLC